MTFLLFIDFFLLPSLFNGTISCESVENVLNAVDKNPRELTPPPLTLPRSELLLSRRFEVVDEVVLGEVDEVENKEVQNILLKNESFCSSCRSLVCCALSLFVSLLIINIYS